MFDASVVLGSGFLASPTVYLGSKRDPSITAHSCVTLGCAMKLAGERVGDAYRSGARANPS
jgi:hypothetical protein